MTCLNDLDALWWRRKEQQEAESEYRPWPEYHPWLVDCGYEDDIEEE